MEGAEEVQRQQTAAGEQKNEGCSRCHSLLQQLKILSFESDSLKFPSQVSATVVPFYSHALLATLVLQ